MAHPQAPVRGFLRELRRQHDKLIRKPGLTHLQELKNQALDMHTKATPGFIRCQLMTTERADSLHIITISAYRFRIAAEDSGHPAEKRLSMPMTGKLLSTQ